MFSSTIIPHSNKLCANITINRPKEHKHNQTEHSKLHYKQARKSDFWRPKEDKKDKQQVCLFTEQIRMRDVCELRKILTFS